MVYVSKLKCACSLYQPSILGGNQINQGFPGGSMVKNAPAKAGAAGYLGLIPGLGRSPGGGNGNTPVFLPGKSHRQRSLAGCSPWGHNELDTTEHAHIAYRSIL